MHSLIFSFLILSIGVVYSAPASTESPLSTYSTEAEHEVETTEQEYETESEDVSREASTATYQSTSETLTTTSTTVEPLENPCPDSPPNELLYRCTDLQWRLACLPPRNVCYGKFIFGHCYGTETTVPARWVCAGSKVNGNCVQGNDYWTTVGRCDLVKVRDHVSRLCDVFDLVDGVGQQTGCFSDSRHVWSSTECGGQHNLRGQWTYNQDRDTYACASKFDSTVNGKCCLVFDLEEW